MSAWTGEALRAAALEALGEHADPRARDALTRAEVRVALEVANWEGSSGRVEAHAVTLGLDARTLGALRSAPAVVGALESALARAAASRGGQALHELRLVWQASAARPVPQGYRDAPPGPPLTVGEALAEYLAARGEQELARWVAAGHVGAGPGEVRVVVTGAEERQLRGDPRAIEVLTEAARDLMGSAATRLVVDR